MTLTQVDRGGKASPPGECHARQVLLSPAATQLLFWSIAHLFPTTSVVRGFGEVSLDNGRTITMEWIVEGISLILIGAVVAGLSTSYCTDVMTNAAYWLCFAALSVLSFVSLFIGCWGIGLGSAAQLSTYGVWDGLVSAVGMTLAPTAIMVQSIVRSLWAK